MFEVKVLQKAARTSHNHCQTVQDWQVNNIPDLVQRRFQSNNSEQEFRPAEFPTIRNDPIISV
jgi:hypothetical protein